MANYPLPKFHFQVEWGGTKIGFTDVSGLDITISLLDETLAPVIVWKVKNAWPTKITSTDLKADGNDVAIEQLDLAHEGFTIQNE